MRFQFRLFLNAVALAFVVSSIGCAAEAKIGEKAPEFSGLTGVDGEKHALANYKEAEAVVLVFTCNHCPVAKAYEDRLIAIQKVYEDKGVQVIAINSNSPKQQPQDSLERMKDRAAGRDLGGWREKREPFNFPYLFDATQKVAKAYGATCTPHVFILDEDRKIAYTGAIDDNMKAKKVKTPFVRNALDAILAGEKPPKAVTKQFGCGIKWE